MKRKQDERESDDGDNDGDEQVQIDQSDIVDITQTSPGHTVLDDGSKLGWSSIQNDQCTDSLSLKEIVNGKWTQMIQINFMIDIHWFMNDLLEPALSNIPILFLHGMDLPPEAALNTMKAHRNIQVIKARLPFRYGTHHSKLMFLFNDKDQTMQFVIHTANLIEDDWKFKTQMIYTTPSLSTKDENSATCDYETDLKTYLDSYGPVMKTWSKKILSYDFSSLIGTLIPTIPYQGPLKELGHYKLGKALSDTQCNESIIQCSSIGSLGKNPDDYLLGEFQRSLMGNSNGAVKLIYPTFQQVQNSFEGLQGGSCLPYSENTDRNQSHYLRPLCYKWIATRSGRTRAMPHCKTYLGLNNGKTSWFVVTSANLSKSAWGYKLKSKNQVLFRSYEMGILFKGIAKVPYDLPLTKYTKHDQIWTMDRMFSE